MGYGPISCRTCHYGIVTQANTWSQTSMGVTTYDPVPLASRRLHVNGARDVLFDTVNLAIYAPTSTGTTTYDVTGAAYDPATKSCASVACHQQQTRVTWGTPYRWWLATECNLCHKM
jgi:predicted CxxxxCH...CXXCH cytochrome family protein